MGGERSTSRQILFHCKEAVLRVRSLDPRQRIPSDDAFSCPPPRELTVGAVPAGETYWFIEVPHPPERPDW